MTIVTLSRIAFLVSRLIKLKHRDRINVQLNLIQTSAVTLHFKQPQFIDLSSSWIFPKKKIQFHLLLISEAILIICQRPFKPIPLADETTFIIFNSYLIKMNTFFMFDHYENEDFISIHIENGNENGNKYKNHRLWPLARANAFIVKWSISSFHKWIR